tara:strand:+ start:1963 stop:3411 length:1449 start_codon:yes stop_codon:yes gene_type:complete
MGKIRATIIDSETGGTIDAKAQVIDSSGHYIHPKKAIQKVGPGQPFFYTDGMFEVDVTRGNTRITVERGTEYTPKTIYLDSSAKNIKSIEIELSRWNDLQEQGWHPGNTHIHYDEKENRPDERLHLDPRVENLRMTAVSVLKRWDLNYSTNKYPIGFLNDFSSDHHYVQNGEESRHNQKPWEIGYGHIMLLDIRNAVDPMSRGLLVDAFEPDYPPLSYACDKAHQQGGTVIWCHNGQGMEAPVAAALGKIDAFNLFDPYWNDTEYDIYYQMLNAGIKLPASTGSDWYICSSNRVYSWTGNKFEYSEWLDSFKRGQTFITNGPSLQIRVGNSQPGDEIESRSGEILPAEVKWTSHYPVQIIELVQDGKVVGREEFPEGSTKGNLNLDLNLEFDGWIAARLFSSVRDSYLQPQFAHTSPIYVKTGLASAEKAKASLKFVQQIEESLNWVSKKGRFYNDYQRREIETLFREAQDIYKNRALEIPM